MGVEEREEERKRGRGRSGRNGLLVGLCLLLFLLIYALIRIRLASANLHPDAISRTLYLARAHSVSRANATSSAWRDKQACHTACRFFPRFWSSFLVYSADARSFPLSSIAVGSTLEIFRLRFIIMVGLGRIVERSVLLISLDIFRRKVLNNLSVLFFSIYVTYVTYAFTTRLTLPLRNPSVTIIIIKKSIIFGCSSNEDSKFRSNRILKRVIELQSFAVYSKGN